MMERYEGRAHCSGSSETSMGSSTHSPLMEIQELIPNRIASRSTRKILRLRFRIVFIFIFILPDSQCYSVTVLTVLECCRTILFLYEILNYVEE